jgi:tetratricopeptide (TPR) repeat protein
MDKVSNINIDQNPRARRRHQSTDRRNFSNSVESILVFLIIILTILLGWHLIFNNETPRTSLERDIMDNTSRLKSNPDDPVAHAGLGAAYIKMGQIDEALAEFKEAIRLKPKSAQYRYNLAVVYRDKGETEKALRELDEAQSLDSDWDAPYFTSGLIYLAQKKYKEAAWDFRACIDANPGNADAHFSLGQAYAALGKKEQAAGQYAETLKYVPDYDGAEAALKKLEGK